MHVHLRRAAALTFLAGSAVVTSASCARDDSSIFIRGVVDVSRTDCTFQVSDNPTLLLQGSIDAAYAGEYKNVVIVENQLVARGDPTTLKTETSRVQLFEAEVQVLDPSQGNGAIAKYSTPVSGFADPSMAGQPGATGSEVLMIDAATIKTLATRVTSTGLAQTVVASVTILGRTLGGQQVHTQEFLYPIEVFYGTTCGSTGGNPCVSSMSANVMNDCRLGLDESTPCQNIAANLGLCHRLECTLVAGVPDPGSAVCPSSVPPNDSCCECGTSGQNPCPAPKTCVNSVCQ
jgi:hypothetical protein